MITQPLRQKTSFAFVYHHKMLRCDMSQLSPTQGGLTLRQLMSYIYIYIYIYIYDISSLKVNNLTLILLTWRKWWAPNNASKEQMGFNSGFKGLSSRRSVDSQDSLHTYLHIFIKSARNMEPVYFKWHSVPLYLFMEYFTKLLASQSLYRLMI